MSRASLVVLGFLLVVAPLVAQVRVPRVMVVGELGTCAAGLERLAIVVDAQVADTCAVGDGSEVVLCLCTGSAWVAVGGASAGGGGSGDVTAVADCLGGSCFVAGSGLASVAVLAGDGAGGLAPRSLVRSDLPALDAADVVTGTFDVARIPALSYVAAPGAPCTEGQYFSAGAGAATVCADPPTGGGGGATELDADGDGTANVQLVGSGGSAVLEIDTNDNGSPELEVRKVSGNPTIRAFGGLQIEPDGAGVKATFTQGGDLLMATGASLGGAIESVLPAVAAAGTWKVAGYDDGSGFQLCMSEDQGAWLNVRTGVPCAP